MQKPQTTRSYYGSITGVIFDRDYLSQTFDTSFRQVCKRHFGCDGTGVPHLLHRRVLAVPPKEGPFSVLRDESKRESWDSEAIRMFRLAKFTAITVSIDKIAFYYENPEWNGDFYEILVTNAIERFFYFLRSQGTGDVVIENKSDPRDHGLKAGFQRAFDEGFRFIKPWQLREVFESKELKIEPKRSGIPGLQLADLLAGPSFNHCSLAYGIRKNELPYFSARIAYILETKKYYRDKDGNPDGYGRVWRPEIKRPPNFGGRPS